MQAMAPGFSSALQAGQTLGCPWAGFIVSSTDPDDAVAGDAVDGAPGGGGGIRTLPPELDAAAPAIAGAGAPPTVNGF
jgi:hypothetical protein